MPLSEATDEESKLMLSASSRKHFVGKGVTVITDTVRLLERKKS
jgi:hypothetical protein